MVVDCIPGTVKLFDYMLSVDVLGVGDCLLSIPILAECVISPLKLGTEHPYTHTHTLNTQFPTPWSVIVDQCRQNHSHTHTHT